MKDCRFLGASDYFSPAFMPIFSPRMGLEQKEWCIRSLAMLWFRMSAFFSHLQISADGRCQKLNEWWYERVLINELRCTKMHFNISFHIFMFIFCIRRCQHTIISFECGPGKCQQIKIKYNLIRTKQKRALMDFPWLRSSVKLHLFIWLIWSVIGDMHNAVFLVLLLYVGQRRAVVHLAFCSANEHRVSEWCVWLALANWPENIWWLVLRSTSEH